MSSQAKTYAIAAAGKVMLSGGTAFALLSAAAAVTVTVWRSSVAIAVFEGVLGGLNWKSRDARGELLPFDLVEISSATAQSVVAFSGDGDVEYSRSQGDVSVLSTAPRSLGTSEVSVDVTSFGATLLAAATNVNGVIVHSLWAITVGVAAGAYMRIVAATSLPGTINDVVTARSLLVLTTNNGNDGQSQNMPMTIPAGVGIFGRTSGTSSGTAFANITIL